jgi:hypothetical protein
MTPPVVRLGVWIGFTRVPNSFHSSTVNKQVTKNLSDVLLVIIYDYSKKTADTMDSYKWSVVLLNLKAFASTT